MGEFKFETQGTSSFLTYCLDEEEKIDTMSMGMISNNRIDGTVPFQYLQMDRDRYFKYNISSTVSLTHYLSGMVNRKRIISVMTDIADTVLNAEEYMLEAGAFIWDKEYIFVNVKGNRTQMVCLPIASEGRAGKEDIEQFLRQLLLSVQFDQNENCDYVARLLGFFNANMHFSLSNFKQLLNQLSFGGYTDPNCGTVSPSPVNPVGGMKGTPQPVVPTPPLPQESGRKPQPPVGVTPNPASTPITNQQKTRQMPFPIPGANAVPPAADPQKGKNKTEKKGFSFFSKNKKEKQQKTPDVPTQQQVSTQQVNPVMPQGGSAGTTKSNPYGSFATMRIPGQDQMVINAQVQNKPQPTGSAQSRPAAPKFQIGGKKSGKKQQDSKAAAPIPPIPTPAPNPVSAPAEDRTEIIDEDRTEILDDSATQIDMSCAWLELISATQSGAMQRIDLNFPQGSAIIGRHSNDVQQPDIAFPAEFKKIGRKHARIDRRGGEYYLTDLGSVNHTLLNGNVLNPQQPYLLTEGMELTLTSGKTVQYRVHLQ